MAEEIEIEVTASSPAPAATTASPDKEAESQQYGGLNFSERMRERLQKPRGSLVPEQTSQLTNLRRPSIIEMVNSGGLVINQRGSCEIKLENLPAQDVELMYEYHGHRRGSFDPSEIPSWNQSLDTRDSSQNLDDDDSRDSHRWWSQKFNSPILEKHLGRTVIEFLRRRFRVALLFIGLFTLIWIVFFAANIPFTASLPPDSLQAVSINTDLAVYSVQYGVQYVVGAAVLFVCTTILLIVTYFQYYKVIAVPLSACLIVVLMFCSFALALALHFDHQVQGFLTMSYVAQFTITSVVILITFMLSRMRTWISFIQCLLYLLILEVLLAAFTFAPRDPSVTQNEVTYPSEIYIHSLVARVLFYVCLILVGVSTSHLTQLRQRATFWKIAQCVLSQKALELERELEEKTILSMMPKPFADDLMNVQTQMTFMLKTKVGVESDASLDPLFQSISTPFNICSMENVTILFADIVNFTKFSSSLSASELVGILNDVFSAFDELAMQTNCEKISTLGDCYFCVSGCPEPAEEHADNCVNMGLSIVKSLEEFRRKTGLPIHMRIGIHTGSVFCGVMGTKRFKFDVWSKDVRIATKVESTGSPGKVLISSVTKSFLPTDDYNFERVSTPSGSSDLSGLKLYFVESRFPAPEVEAVTLKEDEELDKYHSLPARLSLTTCESPIRKVSTSLCPFWRTNRTTAPVGRPLHESQTATSIVDIFSRQKQLQRCTSYAELPVPEPTNENNDRIVELMEEQKVNFDTYFDPKLKLVTLDFHDPDLEASYRNHGQDLDDGSNGGMAETTLGFRITKLSYMIDTAVLFISYLLMSIGSIVCLSADSTLGEVWPALLTVFVIGLVVEVAILVFVTAVFAPKLFPKRFARFSTFIINWYARAVVALFMIYYPMSIVCVSIAQCNTGFDNESVAGLAHVQMAFFVTILVLISSINFMDVSHLVKCIGGILSSALAIAMIVGVHMTLCIQNIPDNFTVYGERGKNERISPMETPQDYVMTYFTRHVAPEAIVLLLLVLILLVVVNRMSEVSVRLSFIARIEASGRRRLARIRKAQADWLLFNIIPDHVARHLRKSGKYSKNHECVGVIFASIVNFRDFQLNTPNSDEESLRVLNIIISEFDALLDREQFSNVEKIKTIGSTYMAASGLTQDTNGDIQHLFELINFSERLIEVLEQINAQMPGFVFRMRIGFNYGPVTAGVVGCRKMLFDIWGDTVNVASRMDSTGLVNKIHAPENCLTLLSPFVTHETYKVVNVKGKGEMKTVFLKRGTDMPPHRATYELH